MSSQIGRLRIFNIPVLPKTIYRHNAIPTKIPKIYFSKIEKCILKFIWNLKEPQIAKITLKEEESWRSPICSDIKTYYEATATKTLWYWYKDKLTGQRLKQKAQKTNRLKLKNKVLCIWSNDLQQGCQDYSRRKGQSSQKLVLEQLDIRIQKKEVGPLLYTIYKNQLKMDQRPNIRAKTIKHTEENIGQGFMILDLPMISWLHIKTTGNKSKRRSSRSSSKSEC